MRAILISRLQEDPLRLNFRAAASVCLMLGVALICHLYAAPRQPQEMLPDESAAKAKQVLQQVITALGGPAYLNVRDSDCSGRIARFGAVGDAPEFTEFRDLWLLPDKNRTEYSLKGDRPNALELIMGAAPFFTHGGRTVTVFNGDQGWSLDKSGVAEEPADLIETFNDGLKTSMDHMLRVRLKEPGVEAQYGGPDIIDRKEAEWIQFTDRDHRDLRLGVDKLTHLPLRWVIATRDPETRERTEIITTYVQYLTIDGVKAPLSLERYKNDHRVSQTFLSECKFNSGLDPQLFTRASLEQRAAQATKKGYKDSKATK